jgi:hypothetical protein
VRARALPVCGGGHARPTSGRLLLDRRPLSADQRRVIDMPMDVLLGKPPQDAPRRCSAWRATTPRST